MFSLDLNMLPRRLIMPRLQRYRDSILESAKELEIEKKELEDRISSFQEKIENFDYAINFISDAIDNLNDIEED